MYKIANYQGRYDYDNDNILTEIYLPQVFLLREL